MEFWKKVENFAFQWLIDKPHTWQGIIIILVAATAVFLSFHAAIKDDFDYEWMLYGILYISIFIGWLIFKYHFPKNKKNRIGLVIALYAGDHEAKKLKRKFIRELGKNINSASLQRVFKIIELKNHQAEYIRGVDDIKKINEKILGHFYLFGDMQKEVDGSVSKYFINLQGCVIHRPVPVALSNDLSFDFNNVLPKEINFQDIFGYRCVRATSRIVYLATRYVVGAASLISGDPFLAYELHSTLETEFDEYGGIKEEIGKNGKGKITKLDLKYLGQLKKKVLKIISNEAVILAKVYHQNNKLDQCIRYLEIAEAKNPENYNVWLLKAVVMFQQQQSSVEAMKCIKKAEKYAQGKNEWRYSRAFLLFWDRKFEEAYKECQKISKLTYNGEHLTVDEVEHFNLSILAINNQKPQLYFWIGYLVLKKRNDHVLAKDYFGKFLLASQGKISFLEKKTGTFLSTLN